jgi:hypothetical protein
MRASMWGPVLVSFWATNAWGGTQPYVGTWQLNPAKSDFGEMTITFAEMADGGMKITVDGQSYTVKADGKEYPTPWGSVTSWKNVDASTWETTNKVDGKVTGTSTLRLGADGRSLSVDSKNIKADGKSSSDSSIYQRVSGTSGLSGKWKTKNVKIGSPGTLTIADKGADGLTLTFVEEKGTCDAKFDGKDHPATGPIWPSGWTCSIAKNGATGFDVVWKKDRKVMYNDSFKISTDGKVLTNESDAPAVSEKIRAVYDRQT